MSSPRVQHGLLEAIRQSAVERGQRARSRVDELRRLADARPPAPPLRLETGGFDLIAEIKRRAPSTGRLASREPSIVEDRATDYAAAGAAAVSVLTEPSRFDGDLEDLAAAAERLPCPVLRKDFLVDPAQLIEARAFGAGGALLILRLLSDRVLSEMVERAAETSLFLLVEGFDEADLERLPPVVERCRAVGVTLLAGVNTRDLETFEVDPHRLERLRPLIPPGVPAVAESGMATPSDVRHAAKLGYRAALVGSALMRADDPAALAAAMLAAGRGAAGAEETRCASG